MNLYSKDADPEKKQATAFVGYGKEKDATVLIYTN